MDCFTVNAGRSEGSSAVVSCSSNHSFMRRGWIGFALLHAYRDPQNSRKKLVVLTPRGASLIDRLTEEELVQANELPVVAAQDSVATPEGKATWGQFKIRSNRHP